MDVHGRKFGAAKDAGDDVIKFVGDAGSQGVEGVKLLLEQQLFAGGDI